MYIHGDTDESGEYRTNAYGSSGGQGRIILRICIYLHADKKEASTPPPVVCPSFKTSCLLITDFIFFAEYWIDPGKGINHAPTWFLSGISVHAISLKR